MTTAAAIVFASAAIGIPIWLVLTAIKDELADINGHLASMVIEWRKLNGR